MASFSAIVLICLVAVPQEECNEKTAVDVMSVRVASEIGCAMGWQELVARSSLREGLGSSAYLKTICRIDRRGEQGAPPPPR
ncbi:hypothetical protein LMIY3S_02080 [Labrys miyagiensis]